MKKHSLLMWFLLTSHLLCAQTEELNLQKYWKYRYELRTRFSRIGTERGLSMPASVIIPNKQYGQADQTTGSIIQWRDATISLSHYWLLLATEYKLLADNNQNVQETLSELYYALNAFNRLDRGAEGYLQGDLNAFPNPENQNGFFIRGDQKREITSNWRFDPPIHNGPIQPDAGHPNMMRSDYEGYLHYDTGGMGDETETVTPQLGSSESLDQLVALLVGLRFIDKFVPDVWVQPTPEDEGYFIKTEARNIMKRLVYYLNDMSPNGLGFTSPKEWTLTMGDEIVDNKGFNCAFASYPIAEMMGFVFGGDERDAINAPGHVNLLFKKGELCEALSVHTFNDALLLGLGPSIASALLYPVFTILDESKALIWKLANCPCDSADRTAVTGPLKIGLPNEVIKKIWKRMEHIDFPLRRDAVGQQVSFPIEDLWININDVPRPLGTSNLLNFAAATQINIADKMTDDDNITIFLQLALIGKIWGPEYFREISYAAGLPHLPLLYDLLYGEDTGSAATASFEEDLGLLNLAPCVGPWADPYDLTHTAPEWASANRLFHPGDHLIGANKWNDSLQTYLPDPEYRGYFPGLDYMVLYNAFHLKWHNQLPTYQRVLSCECVQEISYESTLTQELQVEIKFEDYKEKRIAAESFLSHSMLSSTSIHVNNDLIICRQDPAVPTVLSLQAHALLDMQNGNTLTVRESNAITCLPGSTFSTSSPNAVVYKPTEIIFEKDAVLHLSSESVFDVRDGTHVYFRDGAQIIMDPGSTLRIDNTSFIQLENGARMIYNGGNIFLNDWDARINMVNATIEVAVGVEYSFTSEAGFSNGLIEVKEASATFPLFDLKEESSLRFEGENPTDVLLILNDGVQAVIKSPHNFSDCSFINGKIHFGHYAGLDAGVRLRCRDMDFTTDVPIGNLGGIGGSNTRLYFFRCHFHDVMIGGLSTRINVSLCDFNQTTSSTAIRIEGQSYSVDRSTFHSCGIDSENLWHASSVTFTDFTNERSSNMCAVRDVSNLEINMRSCDITNYGIGVKKTGGMLTSSCTRYDDCNYGIWGGLDCTVNIGEKFGQFNTFTHNGVCIHLDDAQDLWLVNGRNNFLSSENHLIEGTLRYPCEAQSCSGPTLDISGNRWPLQGAQHGVETTYLNGPAMGEASSFVPDLGNISLYTASSIPDNCMNLDLGATAPCAIPCIYSYYYSNEQTCEVSEIHMPQSDNLSIKENKGSFITDHNERVLNESMPDTVFGTIHFNGWPLDSALRIAASNMRFYRDSLGNNETALNYFHEILTADVDWSALANRRLAQGGVLNMKTCFEAVEAEQGLEEPEMVFSQGYTAKYVEVLNQFTQNVSDLTTYQMQLSLESYKGQFFTTLGLSEEAANVYEHLSDCSLDSLEQVILNTWREQVVTTDSLNTILDALLPLDSIQVQADTTSLIMAEGNPRPYYHFGAYIHGPHEIEFIDCGSVRPGHLRETHLQEELTMYPNPTKGVVVINSNTMEVSKVDIFSAQGVLVKSVSMSPRNYLELNLNEFGFSGGLYWIRINGDVSKTKPVIVIMD